MAEEELRNIKEEEEKQKKEYKNEFEEVSKEMKNISKFKEFLKQKQKEKLKLNQIEDEIEIKKELIEEKEQINKKILLELNEVEKQEKVIKKAFEEIKSETGIKKCGDLLFLFKELDEKAKTLKIFVEELQYDISELENTYKYNQEKAKLYNWECKSNNSSQRRRYATK